MTALSIANAQPGPFTTLRDSNLTFNVTTLLTNGLPGLTGNAANLMVFTVQSNSVQNGQAILAPSSLWGRRYIGPGNYWDQAADLVLDSAGNVIVTGNSYGSGTSDDYATIKYSATGTALWTNRFNGSANSNDDATQVAVDGADNIYVTGKSANSAFIVTIKYDPNGVPVWTNQFSDADSPFWVPGGFGVDTSGNAYLSASSLADSSLGYILIKYRSHGTPAWTNRHDETPGGYGDTGPLAVDQPVCAGRLGIR